jgi:hypothetical protein
MDTNKLQKDGNDKMGHIIVHYRQLRLRHMAEDVPAAVVVADQDAPAESRLRQRCCLPRRHHDAHACWLASHAPGVTDVVSGSRGTALRYERGDDMNVRAGLSSFQNLNI